MEERWERGRRTRKQRRQRGSGHWGFISIIECDGRWGLDGGEGVKRKIPVVLLATDEQEAEVHAPSHYAAFEEVPDRKNGHLSTAEGNTASVKGSTFERNFLMGWIRIFVRVWWLFGIGSTVIKIKKTYVIQKQEKHISHWQKVLNRLKNSFVSGQEKAPSYLSSHCFIVFRCHMYFYFSMGSVYNLYCFIAAPWTPELCGFFCTLTACMCLLRENTSLSNVHNTGLLTPSWILIGPMSQLVRKPSLL